MTLERWLEWASADAEQRGLDGLPALLESLGNATASLRAADWNDEADGPSPGDSGEAW